MRNIKSDNLPLGPGPLLRVQKLQKSLIETVKNFPPAPVFK